MRSWRYCVVRCPNGHLSIAEFDAETHKCPYCGTRFVKRTKKETRILYASDSLIECKRHLLKMKMKKRGIFHLRGL